MNGFEGKRAGHSAAFLLLTLLLSAGCSTPPTHLGYRLTGSGTHWDVSGSDRVFEDVERFYPEFFEVILDPARTDLPDLRPLALCGFAVAVANAVPHVKRMADYVTRRRGGEGAVAEVVQHVLRMQKRWNRALLAEA